MSRALATTITPISSLEGSQRCALCDHPLVWWKRRAVLADGQHAHLVCVIRGPPWEDHAAQPPDPRDPAAVAKVEAKVEAFFQQRYRCGLADLQLDDTPGYWQRLTPCSGGAQNGGTCSYPLHTCIGHEGPMHHTVTYFDHARDRRGRWADPTRTWRFLWDAAHLPPVTTWPKQEGD